MYAARALTQEEAEPVRNHLASGCPKCAGMLAESEATLSLLALTLPAASPSQAAREELFGRISRSIRPQSGAADSTASVSSASRAAGNPPAPPWWMQIAIPSSIAAAIAAAVTIFFTIRMQSQMAPPAPAGGMDRTLGILTGVIQTQQQQIASLRSGSSAQTVAWAAQPDLKMISLAGTANQPNGARGRIFWDGDHGVWHFFADGLKPAAPGKTYELWFVSSDQKTKVAAGSFDPTPDGRATLDTKVPANIAEQVTIGAVTDEPAGGSDAQPTGSFQLLGALK